jgi:hypothetical protein
MSYDSYQRSTQNSNVVELYEWSAVRYMADGSTNIVYYRFTSADRTINYLGFDWGPAELRRSNLHKGSGETAAAELVVTARRDMDFVQEHFAAEGAPSASVALKMYRIEPGQTGQAIPFIGDAMFGTFKQNYIDITCMTPEARLTRRIPRMLNQPRCNWFTFDEGCALNPATFMFESVITAIDDRVITITGVDAEKDGDIGYYTGGTLIAPNGERGFIEGSVGDDIILLSRMPLLVVTDTVSLLPGDDFTLKTCHLRFGNAARFTGTTVRQPRVNPYVSGIR